MASSERKSSWRTTLQTNYHHFANADFDYPFVALLLLGELVLGSLIIYKVPYTEIDWIAYMQEVSWWLGGEYDYLKIYGNTGPLVYPAGFLYLFGALQWLTDSEIPKAQIIFLFFYVVTQAVVMILYTMALRSFSRQGNPTQTWSFRFAMICLCLSKRFHSIFLLRLFNDGPTMLMAYLSFICFLKNRWNIGCFFFSLAVSLKMNVLLFAPGLLYLLIQDSPKLTVPRLAICAITQLVLGAPFLLRHPISYLSKAFELDRQFYYKWTVNLNFLGEDLFLSKKIAVFLLLLHLGLLGIYFVRLYKSSRPLTPETILSTLFVSNFIGICCARTLHYQFYSWYFSSLPFLLWRETPYSIPIRLLLLLCIECSFLAFPATATSSAILQAAQWLILIPCVFVCKRKDDEKND
jgi:alpha-1,3-mannosyltransferase